MTWAQLHDALVKRGLAVAGDAGADGPVTGIAYDSRSVQPGNVFVALPGQHMDGAAFVRDTAARGAVAIVSEQAPSSEVVVPWTTVPDARLALAVLAAHYHRHPSRDLQVVGITGTNGKTTTAYLVASIFESAGIRCGILGTLAYRIGNEILEATRTTPEAPAVQCLLRKMVDRASGACAMEVSSHALSLGRVDEMTFAAGIFTNLTREHLDFHADMESYFQAKRRLFEMLPSGAPSLLNIDDPRGLALATAGGRPVTYAINRPADITPAEPPSYSLGGLDFDVRTPGGPLHVHSKLVGRPNVYNILAAVSAATALGLPCDAIERGVRAVDGVPGRFQLASGSKDEVTVVVDYAHTDDALRNLLETARPLARGRLITVFGCGGERDRAKRPLMGAVAGRLSDVIILTSDNPRGEEPDRIIEEILLGITPDTRRDSSQRLLMMPDRRMAIWKAIELASAGDLVLVAGKGHEKHQVIGADAPPFDDVVVAREALARRRAKSGVA